MYGKFKIDNNLLFNTTDKRANKSICLEGHYWLTPNEDYDLDRLYRSLQRQAKRLMPKCLPVFDLPDSIEIGKSSHFQFQIHFLTHTKKSFNVYCKQIMPLILEKIPLFLDIITSCGFQYHKTKKGA